MKRCHTILWSLSAFTLIEMLIGISILIILSISAFMNYRESQIRAKISRVRADTRTIASILELYCVENRNYPLAADGDIMLEYPLTVTTTPVSYITSIPKDPFGIASYDFSVESKKLGYLYLDALSTSRNMPRETYGYIWKLEPSKKYMIHSCGPNRIWDVTPYVEYDPTNGTLSVGDLSSLGP